MTTEVQNIEVENTTSKTISKTAFLGILGLISLCVLVLAIVARKPIQEQSAPTREAHIQQEYRYILGEIHTGLRLTRYRDFLSQYPDNADIVAVRVQHAALKIHEARAWAQLSETAYDLAADTDTKTRAKNVYISQWGTLIRQEALPNLPIQPSIASSDALTFKTAKSHFAMGKDANTLAGAKQDRPKKKPNEIKVTKNKDDDKIVPARIRYARKPTYPRKAKRRGINATISLSLTIDQKGRVIRTKVLVVNASRYEEEFVRAAKRAAKRSRFHQKTINGKPVMVHDYKRVYKFKARN